jgi:hypothetical protein
MAGGAFFGGGNKKKPPDGAGGFIGFGSLLQVCERAPDSSRRRQEKPKK